MNGVLVLTNAFLIDCTGKEPVDGAAVVVEGDRIKDAVSYTHLTLPTILRV